MAIRKKKEKQKVTALRFTISDELAEEFNNVKERAKELGFVFDPKPELQDALKQAIDEALKDIEKQETEKTAVEDNKIEGDENKAD